MSNSKINKIFYLLIISIIFLFPILYYGITDIEGYYIDNLNIKFQRDNNFNPFVFFIDYIGAGNSFPIAAQTPLYHPLNFFFSGVSRNFYIFFILIHLYTQVFYFSKILKILKIKNNFIISIFSIIFLIPNLDYVWRNDWLGIFFSFSIFFPIIYYSIKLIKKKNLDFLNLVFWLSFGFINSHPGHFSLIFIYILFFFIFNLKNLTYIFKKKIFYFSFLLLIIICSEKIYYLLTHLSEFSNFTESNSFDMSDVRRRNQPGFILDVFLLSPLSFIIPSTLSKTAFPFSGIFILVSVFISFKLFFEKKSKDLYYLNLVFLFIIILSLSQKAHEILKFISSIWQFRDIFNILGLIIFFKYLMNIDIKKKIILVINLSLIITFSTTIFYKVFYTNNISKNNFLVNNQINNSFSRLNDDIDINKFNNRLYISPGIYRDIKDKKYNNYGIYTFSDFIKLNFSPFQLRGTKVVSQNYKIQLGNSRSTFGLKSRYDEINSEIFLNIFNIKYLLVYENELDVLKNLKNFVEIKNIEIQNRKLILLERQNFNEKVLIKEKNLKCNNDINLVSCIEKNKDKFILSKNFKFEKIEANKYQIIKDNKDLINSDYSLITPFLFSDNWKSKSADLISNFDNRLLIINLVSNENEKIYYSDNNRFYLIIISLTSLLSLFFYLLLIKFKRKSY